MSVPGEVLETMEVITPVRVKVSEGEAEFPSPLRGGVADNDAAGGRWITLPTGTRLVTVARYEKTDTYMLDAQLPGEVSVGLGPDRGTVSGHVGLVLRRASFAKVVDSSKRVQAEVKEPTAV